MHVMLCPVMHLSHLFYNVLSEDVVVKHWWLPPMWPGSNLGERHTRALQVCGCFPLLLWARVSRFFLSSKTKNPYALYIPICCTNHADTTTTSHKVLRSVSGQKKKKHFLFRNILQELKRSESLFWVNLVNHWFGTVIGLFIKTQRTNKDTNRTIFCCGEVCRQRWYAIFDGES